MSDDDTSSSSSSTGPYVAYVLGGLTINQVDWALTVMWTVACFWKIGGAKGYDHSFHSEATSGTGGKRCCKWDGAGVHLHYWLTFLSDAMTATAIILYWRNRIDQANYDITMALIASYLALDKITDKMHGDFDLPFASVAMQTITFMMSIVMLVFIGLSAYTLPIGFFAPVVFWQLVNTWALFDQAVGGGGGTNMCSARLARRGRNRNRNKGGRPNANADGSGAPFVQMRAVATSLPPARAA